MNKKELAFYAKNEKERENLTIEKHIDMLSKYDKIINTDLIELPNIRKVVELKEYLENFMNFKYPDRFLDWAKNPSSKKTKEFYRFKESFNALDMNQLKFRLDNDMLSLMECPYDNYVSINNTSSLEHYDISLDVDGDVTLESIELLKKLNIISNDKKSETIDELQVDLDETMDSDNNAYTSDGVKAIKYVNNEKKELRRKIFESTALDLLYDHNTSIENGYYRAISFLRMVNKEYKLDIKLEKIVNPSYLDSNKSMIKF